MAETREESRWQAASAWIDDDAIFQGSQLALHCSMATRTALPAPFPFGVPDGENRRCLFELQGLRYLSQIPTHTSVMGAPTQAESTRINFILNRYPELHQLVSVMVEQNDKGFVDRAFALSRYIAQNASYDKIQPMLKAKVYCTMATGESYFQFNDLGLSALQTAGLLVDTVLKDTSQLEAVRIEARQMLANISFDSDLCREKANASQGRARKEISRESVRSARVALKIALERVSFADDQ